MTTTLSNTLSKNNVFNRITTFSIPQKILLSVIVACLTGLAAQIRIPLPFTPVPITGQTFAVLMAGMVLGSRYGALSQLLYLIFGAAGMPWFSDLSGGLSVILGPTGGYILGFIVTAYFVGWYCERDSKHSFIQLFTVLMAANLFLIFAPGLSQLAIWYKVTQGSFPSLSTLLTLGFTPFVVGAVIKTFAATLIGKALMRVRG